MSEALTPATTESGEPTLAAPVVNKASAEPVLQVHNLVRTFGSLRAVDDLSFEAHAGEVVGFIGPNGAGKTTTMRIAATLDVPDRGDVRVCGYSVIDHPDRARRYMGYMPDSFGKYANMNVLDYLDFYARAYGLRGSARVDAVDRVLTFTELRQLQQKPIRGLSKGQSQRLGLGRTLIHDPRLLILDEPAAGLDPRARVELRELVHLLARELGKTVLISSHILTELGEICDSVVIIEAGKALAAGKVSEIQKRQRAARQLATMRRLSISLTDTHDDSARERLLHWLIQQPQVETGNDTGHHITIDFSGTVIDQHDLLKRLLAEGFLIAEFTGKQETLEDAFMDITKGIMQ